MTRKRTLSFFLGFLLLCAFFPVIIPPAQASDPEIWALIVNGSRDRLTFYYDTRYMYKVLNEDYGVSHDNIIYLSVHYPNTPWFVDGLCTLYNVKTAINTTLANSVGENDIVFMYFSSHGGGYNLTTNEPTHELLLDINGDEGDEHEKDGDWVGCDECIEVDIPEVQDKDRLYLDDDLADDVDCINCAKLIFVRQGCVEGNQSCFGGGLIDDISGPKRIIMTASNETGVSWGDMDDEGAGYGFSEWSERFIDALHGQRARWDDYLSDVVDVDDDVDADWNNDGNVSMWEAWDYAWKNDEARLAGLETPWLDDNGNGEPTYRNEGDDLDQTDGLLSMETYFGFDNLKSPDVNDDGIVDILDIATISKAYGSHGPDYPNPGDPPSENWNEDADLNNDNKVDTIDVATAAKHYGKCYEDPPSPVSTETILFTYPFWTVARKGETFSVNVVLFNVDNLRGWEFKLYWNNTVLECIGAQIRVPDVWSENVVEAGPGVENDFNATHGRYWIAVSALHPAPPFNGSTVVATLTFEARAAGSTMLDLQETKLAHNELYAIPHTAIDGLVKVRKR